MPPSETAQPPAEPPVEPHALPLSVPADPDRTGGRRIGVLVQHGFTGSPHSMRAWAEHLAGLGYAVEMPRLPGHGTTWQQMNETGWDDWYGEVRRAYDKLAAENDVVVAAGLSMGGALVLRLAADHPGKLAGLVLVNPGVATRRLDVRLLPVLKRVTDSFPAIGNDIKKPGQDEHAYPKTPLRAAHSMMLGWKVLRADLPRVTAPLLYFRSTKDKVVDDLSERVILARVGSTEVTFRRLTDSYHVATMDNDAETVFAESAAFIARVAETAS